MIQKVVKHEVSSIYSFLKSTKTLNTFCIAVSVSTGASSDPSSIPGLAHFTEHMCFLGSQDYPGENEYKSFLSKHGGRSNASTSMSSTTFKFDIPAEHFEPALDIFSAFFVCPLFTESCTGREVNAVDSENSKNMSTDNRRRLQILKAVADPTHHYSKFSTGNKLTLYPSNHEGDESIKTAFVRQALLAFHEYHYVPDNMVVVCIGPQSLDTLENMVVPRFGRIHHATNTNSRTIVENNQNDHPDKTLAETIIRQAAKEAPVDMFFKLNHVDSKELVSSEQETANQSIYNPAFQPHVQDNRWPIIITINPLKSVRHLYLYFPLPPSQSDPCPLPILSHLLGHEGPGSCFAALQDAELATSMSAGPRLLDVDQTLFQISISLTELGEKQWEHVVKIVFEYVHLLRQTVDTAVQKRNSLASENLKDIWHELLTLRRLNFNQTLPGDPYSTAPNLANSVRRYGTQDCLCKGSMLNETRDTFPLHKLKILLRKMNPDNCMVERTSQEAWNELKMVEEDVYIGKDPTNNGDDVFGFKKEKWYGIQYHLRPASRTQVNMWNDHSKLLADLHLPKKNEYIPTNLSLCPDLPQDALQGPQIEKELLPPNLLHKSEFGRLWHRLDDRYCQPKASFSILIRTPDVENIWNDNTKSWEFDTETSMKSVLLMNIFTDALAQDTYDARLAGLHWNLSKSSKGIVLKCAGYSQHLPSLMENIMKRFFTSKISGDGSFLTKRYFESSKDSMVRHLHSYLRSQRADVYASYYTELLISSQSKGISHTAKVIESITLKDIKDHHSILCLSGKFQIDCLFSGNFSENDATVLFSLIKSITNNAIVKNSTCRDLPSSAYKWVPGPNKKKLKEGEDIHLHFQSDNDEEENGAVTMTFLSHLPSFKGRNMSSTESLMNSASIRVLCHMLREPLFNQLRTKEQLGYIVNSYYDLGFCTKNVIDSEATEISFSATPIDSIVVNILSKKVPPPVLTQRVDEFLDSFRERLSCMDKDEIKSHTKALSQKLMEPKKKLGDEVALHFSKISRYAPEILQNNCVEESSNILPWNSATHLAEAMEYIDRDSLLKTWDNVISCKRRSRIVSHVYGKIFPFNKFSDFRGASDRNISNIQTIAQVMAKRNELTNFSYSCKKLSIKPNWKIDIRSALGTGFLLLAIATLNRKKDKTSK